MSIFVKQPGMVVDHLDWGDIGWRARPENTGCKTFVNDATRLNTIADDWMKAGCDKVIRICPKILCIVVSGATCNVSGTTGMCVDTHGVTTTQ